MLLHFLTCVWKKFCCPHYTITDQWVPIPYFDDASIVLIFKWLAHPRLLASPTAYFRVCVDKFSS